MTEDASRNELVAALCKCGMFYLLVVYGVWALFKSIVEMCNYLCLCLVTAALVILAVPTFWVLNRVVKE